MMNLFKLLIYSLLLTLTITGCHHDKSNKVTENENMVADSVFKYKGSLIGDNSAVGAIINQLSIAEGYNGFQLYTTKEPYGVMINYNWQASEQQYRQTTAYYAIYFFTLIQNIDYVTLNFLDQEYSVTKADLIDWYGEDFTQIDNEAELEAFISAYFNPERVNDLFL